MRGVFVTGTDTDAGKTLVASALLAGAPPGWRYWKPVQTGLAVDAGDTARVRARTGAAVLDMGARLQPPVSPHHAAALAGLQLDVATVLAWAQQAPPGAGPLVVEGAGGLLVPLNARETLADLIHALDLPLIIVVRVRLGAINHALLTERAALAADLSVLGFVLSGDADPSLETALRDHARRPVLYRLPTLDAGAPLAGHGRALRSAVLAAAGPKGAA